MNGKRKGGELRQIKVKEVSVVDAPANQRKFLFLKSDLEKADVSIVIESDGTIAGTKITVNGKEVEDLTNFYFSYYKPAEDEELYIDPVSCSYTVVSDAANGFQTSQSYELAKAEGKKMKDYVKLGAFVKALTGKDVTEDEFKKMDDATLEQLEVLSQYQGQMPTDLTKAVSHFFKLDAEPADPPKDPPKDPPDDPPAKPGELTPEAIASIQTRIDGLTALISGKKDDEPADVSKDVLAKLTAISDRIGKLEKGETSPTVPKEDPPKPDDANKKVLDLLTAIEGRLKIVEKSSGIEKGIDEGGSGGPEPEVDLYKSIDL